MKLNIEYTSDIFDVNDKMCEIRVVQIKFYLIY